MNVDRFNANLRADTGVVIDTAADITPIHRTTKLRNMKLRNTFPCTQLNSDETKLLEIQTY